MTDFNQAIILGNITRDPEFRYTPNGQAVISFSVATNRRWANRETNEPQEATEFHNVVAWGKLAEICNQILYKGRKVLVVGRLQTRSWEGQDGIKRYSTEIIADHISATGSPKTLANTESTYKNTKTQENNDTVPDTSDATKSEPKIEPETKNKSEEINLDDIPF